MKVTTIQFRSGMRGSMTREELATAIGVTAATIENWRVKHEEFPDQVAKGQYPVPEAFEAVIKMFKGTDRIKSVNASRACQALLEAHRGAAGGAPQAEAPEKAQTEPIDAPQGAIAALDRLRVMEATLGVKYAEAVSNSDYELAQMIHRQWKDLVDQLRRLEGEIVEIEEATRRSIPMEEAKKAIAKVVSVIKGRLLLMPSQLAHELAEREVKDVQEILQRQVENMLESMSKEVLK